MSQVIQWDGRTYPYIPPQELKVHANLKRHTRAAEKVDPVTYEVVRHALWNINVEHGNTIMKISGSPSCAYGHDFNPCLLDENGDFVFFGPFLQYLSSATGSAVKWTMEYRSENPGIHDGDIFLTNDPWIGATHQADVALVAPVFWEGELFCWVGNTLHQWDMGGTSPGGFNPMAADVFWESGCIPPIKIVEGGTLQSTMPNVEDNEWFYPILYLWRKELVNSGGAGKYRGGNSGEIAFIPHGTDHISLFTASGHCAVPGPGLHGGLSPATTRFTIQRSANVVEQAQETRRMPTSAVELRGKTEYIAPKAFDVS